MEFKNTISTMADDIAVPHKLLLKIEEHYKTLQRIEIFRQNGSQIRKVNEITFRSTTAGHPEEDTVAIGDGVMKAIFSDARALDGGAARYQMQLWISDTSKRSISLRKQEIATLLDEDEGITQIDKEESIEQSAMIMVQESNAQVTQIMREGLEQAYGHIDALNQRILEGSQITNLAMTEMQKLLGTVIEQNKQAIIDKDRALSLIYHTKVSEAEAEASAQRAKMAFAVVSPALLLLADRIGTKFGIPMSAVMDMAKDATKTEGETEKPDAEPVEPEDPEMVKLAHRLQTHPITTRLDGLRVSISPEQWGQIGTLKPKKVIDAFRHALNMGENEIDAKTAVINFAALAIKHDRVKDGLEEIFTDQQNGLVKEIENTLMPM